MEERRIRGLLVEDDAPYGRLVTELLRFARGPGMDLSRVERLSDALAVLEEELFDVVLLDVTLPDAVGLDPISQVHSAFPQLPILVLTGHDDERLAMDAVRHGAQDYLVKGHFDGNLLMRAVRYSIERSRAEVETRRHQARLAAVVERLPEGVLLVDATGRLLQANRTAREILPHLLPGAVEVGHVLDEVAGIPLLELLVPPREGQWHEAESLRGGQQHFEVRADRLSPAAGAPAVIVVRDVTEQKRVAEYVEAQQRLAAVGELAAGVAHDFNNVLQVMIGAADLLRHAPELTDSSRRRASLIAEQGQHAARTIQQILAFSRRSLLERRPLDLGVLLPGVLDVLRRVLRENIEIVVRIANASYPVLADPTLLQQVVTNLAVNARDAMADGGTLTISLDRRNITASSPGPFKEMRSGDWAVLSVSDTGVGMDSAVLARVFEPFFTTKEVGEGTGLGLSQVYGSVGQHDGFIDVRSRVGVGTTFSVFLPLDLEAVVHDAVRTGLRTDPPPPGRTVLVVEDEGDVRAMLADILQFLGYDVLTASNGVEALDVFEREGTRIGIVLTDMTMPAMGGIELARELHRRSPAMKVLVLTGYPLNEDAEVLNDAAVCGWVQKPIEIDHLSRILDGAFSSPPATA